VAPTHNTRQLNWFLAWAVVFCDIGTSVYYVPGILYGHVQDATPFFVLLTTGGFILLSLKYIEISWRNPEGGGVVTITTKAFGPMWGCCHKPSRDRRGHSKHESIGVGRRA
jgi:amino acid transporter